MSTSRLDAVYRSILITKFFTKGWGKPDNLRRLFEFRKVISNREQCFKLVERDYPVTITKEQKLTDCHILEGYFTTPLERYLPGIVPEIAQKAHFQIILPVQWSEKNCKPMCLHLAGTGDHFFWRRRNLMVRPLLKEAGIGGIILENPFYGLRKPTDQIRSSLHNVSDIFVMGGCLILESLVLFHWCERNGLGPLGVTGLSMGGHMASLAATNWPKPLVLVPCLSWSTASAVFLQGVMSQSINWDLLEDQYLSDGTYREKLAKMVRIVDEAFLAGKKFAQNYSHNVDNTAQNIKTTIAKDSTKDISCNAQKISDTNAQIIGVTDSIIKDNKECRKEVKKSPDGIQRLHGELDYLLQEDKISKTLHEKLKSNEKFQLDPNEIDDINKLTADKFKELLFKYKVAELKNYDISNPFSDNSKGVQIPAKDEIKDQNSTKNVANVINKNEDRLKSTDEVQITKNIDDKLKAGNEIVKTKDLDTKETNQINTKKKSWNVSELTSDLWLNFPFVKSGRKINISKIHWRDREALQFMRGVMDECTHLSNFSIPYDTSLIIAVCAKHDAYVPRDDVGTLEEIWPGAEVRYVDAGHVSAYILHQSLFRSCIKEAFEKSIKKWNDGEHIE